MPGKLFIIATPIGNLSDLTPRTQEALSQCDFILAEDTRVSIKLLNHLSLKISMFSCYDFNEERRLNMIEQAAQSGQVVALLSDAGTPLISDPGYQIVRQAIDSDMTVIPIPGPSAFLLALVASGLPCHKFTFEGFLPDKFELVKKALLQLQDEKRTMVFYVSPHKIRTVLLAMAEVFGERKICLARELTKKHEEFIRTTILGLLNHLKNKEVLGECVLVLEGVSEKKSGENALDQQNAESELKQIIQTWLNEGLSTKTIINRCSEQFGLKRSISYKLVLAYLKDKKLPQVE